MKKSILIVRPKHKNDNWSRSELREEVESGIRKGLIICNNFDIEVAEIDVEPEPKSINVSLDGESIVKSVAEAVKDATRTCATGCIVI